MKTTFYIIVTFFGLQSNFLFANGTSAQTIYSDELSYHSNAIVNTVSAVVPFISIEDLKILAPGTPNEADFSDNDLITLSAPASRTLAPVTPIEADFNDSDADNLNLLIPNLAPKTPGEADFLDTDTTNSGEGCKLAPVAPAEATFEDLV
ncbi:MAG: hypothetical protein NTY96_07925 [Bacteroidetes bacterium]|nr:hypothetical protein [Bacteroidota bacterium]